MKAFRAKPGYYWKGTFYEKLSRGLISYQIFSYNLKAFIYIIIYKS